MKILVVPDPAAPYGEDAFCRELAAKAAGRGHEAVLSSAPEAFNAAEVVLVNNLQPGPISAARACGRKVAVRLIESYADTPPAAMEAIRGLALQADMVLVPSRYLADIVKSWGCDGRTRQVPYAYDRIMAHQIALVTMRASRPADFQIVTTCKFGEACRPGIEMLISAVARLRFDWHLAIVGDGPILHSIKDRVRQLLPAEKVMFAGALAHLKTMEYFRAAKAFVDPSGLAGFPSMTLYALSEGCPVVAPRAGAVTEVITDGKNGLLFNPGDPVSLSEAIVTLSSVRGLSLQLIAEGIKTVERHTWDATVSAAFTALEELKGA